MTRLADPYRDLDVIDRRAPRANQLAIGVLAVVAFLTGWWPILGLLALQLVVGITLGRRWCIACVAYFELVQPRIGEGPLEDSRSPRFANMMGAVVLTVGDRRARRRPLDAGLGPRAARRRAGAPRGRDRVLHRLRDLPARRAPARRRPRGAPPDRPCRRRRGGGRGRRPLHPSAVLRVPGRRAAAPGGGADARDGRRPPRPDLARKYGIGIVPTAVAVAADGAITARLA